MNSSPNTDFNRARSFSANSPITNPYGASPTLTNSYSNAPLNTSLSRTLNSINANITSNPISPTAAAGGVPMGAAAGQPNSYGYTPFGFSQPGQNAPVGGAPGNPIAANTISATAVPQPNMAALEESLNKQLEQVSGVLVKFQQQVTMFENETENLRRELLKEKERVANLENTLGEAQGAFEAKRQHLETLMGASENAIRSMQTMLNKAGTREELEAEINKLARELHEMTSRAQEGEKSRQVLQEETARVQQLEKMLQEAKSALENLRVELREVVDDNKKLLQALATKEERESRDLLGLKNELHGVKSEQSVVLQELKSKTEWAYEVQQELDRAKKELRRVKAENEQLSVQVQKYSRDHEENYALKHQLEAVRAEAQMAKTMLEMEKSRRESMNPAAAGSYAGSGFIEMSEITKHLEQLQEAWQEDLSKLNKLRRERDNLLLTVREYERREKDGTLSANVQELEQCREELKKLQADYDILRAQYQAEKQWTSQLTEQYKRLSQKLDGTPSAPGPAPGPALAHSNSYGGGLGGGPGAGVGGPLPGSVVSASGLTASGSVSGMGGGLMSPASVRSPTAAGSLASPRRLNMSGSSYGF